MKALLHLGQGRVGEHDVAPLLQVQGPLEGLDLDLPADALGTLPPLELDGVQVVPGGDVLGRPEARVLDVHLDEDLAVSLVELLVGLDPPIHLGGLLDLALGIEHQVRVDPADVLAADDGDPGDGRADREMLPVLPGDLGGPEGPGEDGDPQFHLLVPAVGGLGVHRVEDRRVGADIRPLREPLCAPGVPLDVDVGVVDGIVLVRPCGHLPEGPGVEHLAPAEGGEPDVAHPLAAVEAAGADAGHGSHVP